MLALFSLPKLNFLLVQCMKNYTQNKQKKFYNDYLCPSKHSSKFGKCSYEKNGCKDKLMELVELSGYALELCN